MDHQENSPSEDNYFLAADYWLSRKYKNKNSAGLTKWVNNLVFMILFLFFFTVAALAGAAEDVVSLLMPVIFFLVPSAGNLVSMTEKIHLNLLYRRFLRCGRELDGVEYFSIPALADLLHMTERSLQKSLDDMKKQGWLPNATFSEDHTLVLLTDEARERYQAVSMAAQNLPENSLRDNRENALLLGRDDEKMASRTAEQICAGLAAAEEITQISNDVSSAAMQKCLEQLARLIRQICAEVEAHPDRIRIIRRFSDYYLPTVQKLVRRYQELDAESYPTAQTQKSMEEIHGALDLARTAFENLLLRIQSDSRIETSVDISVMKKIMEQEGLIPAELPSDGDAQ